MNQADQERLDAFEKMYQAVKEDQERTIRALEDLKRKGKKGSATYKQLFIQKMSNKNILSLYKIYNIE